MAVSNTGPFFVRWPLRFNSRATAGGDSLVVNQALVTKTYLPRLAVPLAPVLASLVDFGFAFAVLALMLAWFGIAPGPEAALLPVLVLLTVAASLGAALWLAAVNALYRDVRLALPFAVQLAHGQARAGRHAQLQVDFQDRVLDRFRCRAHWLPLPETD